MQPMPQPPSKPGYIKQGFKLAKDYFLTSNERTLALLLLLGVVLSVVGLVVLTSVFAWWNVMFWTALTEMNSVLFIESIQIFAVLLASYTGISVVKEYLISTLSIRWGNWLKQDLLDKYTKSYLNLGRDYAKKIPNPAQRIEKDSQSLVDQALWLSTDLLQSLLMQASFLGTLWVVGGAITVAVLGASMTIPGYLVWVALVFSVLSSIITHYIGKALSKLSNLQKELSANFRKDMASLNEHAESVAQDHGEAYYKLSFSKKLALMVMNGFDILRVKIKLTAFKSFYQQIAWIFPYIVAAPLYFAKKTSLGQLMQVGFAFGQVQTALSWFTNSYEPLAAYAASVDRIVELENAMRDGGVSTSPQAIRVSEHSDENISIRGLNIAHPSSSAMMISQLNLQFNVGEHTLIKGPSGLGKSTLFKVIAGTWTYGNGEVYIPLRNRHRMCFLPQIPVIPEDTLKAVLAYPDSVDTYTDEQYRSVLHDVGGLDKFIDGLAKSDSWSKKLSSGQKQRISFARALLKKPDWLFLDESTASLDLGSETKMYGLLQAKLLSTTFISIAHRPSLESFHKKVVNLSSQGLN